MAKRRDEILRRAEHLGAGAKDMTLKSVRKFDVRIAPSMREVKNAEGRVYKMVSVIEFRMEVGGYPPVESQIEVEAGPNYGIFGEMHECIEPATGTFMDTVEKTIKAAMNAKSKPLDPAEPKPLPSDRGPDLRKTEDNKAAAAAAIEKKKAAEAKGGE